MAKIKQNKEIEISKGDLGAVYLRFFKTIDNIPKPYNIILNGVRKTIIIYSFNNSISLSIFTSQ